MAQKVRIILEDDLVHPVALLLRLSATPRPQQSASGLRLTATKFLTAVVSTRTFRTHTTQQ